MFSRLVVTIFLVTAVQATHHNHSRGSHGDATRVLGFVSGALELVRDTAKMGAKAAVNSGVADVAKDVVSTAVDGAKEVAEIATDPKPIFPGTRWCGAGTRAENSSEIGIFEGSDACCRDHDNCPDNIKAGETKHGLNNTGSFTRSHCDCDDAFYRCLKDDGSLVAKKIGFTYFNVLRPQCFRKTPPIVRCAKTTGVALTKRCEKYEFDKNSTDEQWQWFDAESF